MYRYFLDFCSCRVFGATYAVRFTLVGNVIQLSTVVIMCVYSGDLSAHLLHTFMRALQQFASFKLAVGCRPCRLVRRPVSHGLELEVLQPSL
jgi:hypothetical protein